MSFLMIDVDLALLFSDSLKQANGRDHEPAHSSSEDGNSSEEVDDGHSYAEFVKKNHVRLFSLSYLCSMCCLYSLFFGWNPRHCTLSDCNAKPFFLFSRVKVTEIFLLSMIRHVLVVYAVYGFLHPLSHCYILIFFLSYRCLWVMSLGTILMGRKWEFVVVMDQ